MGYPSAVQRWGMFCRSGTGCRRVTLLRVFSKADDPSYHLAIKSMTMTGCLFGYELRDRTSLLKQTVIAGKSHSQERNGISQSASTLRDASTRCPLLCIVPLIEIHGVFDRNAVAKAFPLLSRATGASVPNPLCIRFLYGWNASAACFSLRSSLRWPAHQRARSRPGESI